MGQTNLNLPITLIGLLLATALATARTGWAQDEPAQSRPAELPELGVAVHDLSNEALFEHGLQYAVLAVEVRPDTPAANSGMEAGDLIYQLNDLPVYSARRLVWLLGRAAPPQALHFTVLRDGHAHTLTIERPPVPQPTPAQNDQ
jgi:S1-C subfamily serine protease